MAVKALNQDPRLTLETLDVVTTEVECSRCGKFTVVDVLPPAAIPDPYVGPCCRRYIGELDWDEK